MTDRKPRDSDDHDYTGTGTTRSADSAGVQRESSFSDDQEADPAVITGATTRSHPAEDPMLNINRSGSGGSGDEGNDEEPAKPAG